MPAIWPTPTGHAQRRGWRWLARFKDDGYSAFKQIRRGCYGVLVLSVRPAVRVRALRADAREGRDGTTVGPITHGD